MANELKIKNGLLVDSGGANITGTSKFNTSLLVVDSVNSRVGINVSSPSAGLHIDTSIRVDNQTGTPPGGTQPGTPLNYYGVDGATYLSDPNNWLKIDIDGNTYYIPVYT